MPWRGLKLLLQLCIDVGFLAGIVIAIHLLHEAHVIVPERQGLRHVGSRRRVDLKDHFRIAHQIALLFPVMAEGNQVSPSVDCPMSSTDKGM